MADRVFEIQIKFHLRGQTRTPTIADHSTYTKFLAGIGNGLNYGQALHKASRLPLSF
jgi:hypothetical protein